MDFGSFQSVFQLSAGLTTGISGLLTVWDDPLVSEAKKLASLNKKAKFLMKTYGNLMSIENKSKLETLISTISEKEGDILLSKTESQFYHLVRFSSLVFSIFSVSMLFISSYYPKSAMSEFAVFATYVIAAFPPVVVIALAFRTKLVSKSIKEPREALDKLYVAVTTAVIRKARQ